jgi:predicted peptidase
MRLHTQLALATLALAVIACRAPVNTAPAPDLAPTTSTPPESRGFVSREVMVDGATYRYRVFAPTDRRGPLPVVLFLHGSGERGSDGALQTFVGLGPAVKARDGGFPAIVVFPQSPNDSTWSGAPARAAIAALDAATQEFGGDRNRTYLTGVSMGGYGTWELALQNPGRFAAIAPVCGGVRPLGSGIIHLTNVPADSIAGPAYVAHQLAHVPTWIFHGSNDGAVPVAYSREMAAAMRAVGAPVHYTEYPGVGHNSWESAYAEPALWRWMFAQRLDRGRVVGQLLGRHSKGTVIGPAAGARP